MDTPTHTTRPSKPQTQCSPPRILGKLAESGEESAAGGRDTLPWLRDSVLLGGSTHLCVLLGDEVHKAEAPVCACPRHLLRQAHGLQFPKGARRQKADIRDRGLPGRQGFWTETQEPIPAGYQRWLASGTPTAQAHSCGFPLPHRQPSLRRRGFLLPAGHQVGEGGYHQAGKFLVPLLPPGGHLDTCPFPMG